MKKIITIIIILALTGCSKDFLDRRSLVQLGEASFWKNEQEARLGINGIYDVLQDRVLYSGTLNATGGASFHMYDCFGDNAFNSYKFEGPGNFMESNIDQSNLLFSNLWNSLYKGIGRANAALENLEKIPAANISDASKKSLIGQAKFLRGLFYSQLAIYFQDAPLILKVQKLEEAYVPKNTYVELSAQVVKDLTEAVDLLPASHPASDYGYATKGAALGLLARFHLYNKNYQGVLDATTPMLTLGYSLNTSYAQLFTEQGEFSKEVVFSIRFNQDVSNNGELFSASFAALPKVNYQPMKNLVEDYYCTDGKPITTSPLYNPATPQTRKVNRDPRLTASVYFNQDTFLTDLSRRFTGNTATTYGLRKYLRRTSVSATGIGIFSPGGQDFYAIRYADILLMRAEAMIELNQLSTAYPLINQVRARVTMPSVESAEGAGLSQDALRTVLRHERRVELAFEGLRYFDLKRWGTLEQAYQRARADAVPAYNPTYMPGGKSEVFAIPLTELNANNKLVQNPLWK
ncbi:RagB/SusD family nutrient uptake outer membrane protein [Lacibacter sediminis]|uniref:RagB/SusD family nutrient uptake outer membrane protein n=1 Tax=Lacibacter sediminis TaxID=2760713 RepID=A0A7G5XKJ4_9BACT|nr:RagB/SusD family nutrient uptake outer membrane protein [Lacibacter sediminis]QNA45997.1 RagB/SusD family nutrient uptake outer membrane protein [Lacibacter sediminis]